MTKQELQDIFESPFNWDNWRKVMDFVFPEFQFSAQKIPVEQFTKAAEERIKGFYHHGSTGLTGQRAVHWNGVEVNEPVNLPRNVKGIRKFISAEAIANTQASVAVFYSSDKTKWRFTLAVKQLDENFKQSDKKPESYTYVFGEGEKGRTAAERFYKLAKNKAKKLADLEEAFSVEALSKKFFKQYKEVYEQFVTNIIGNKSRLSLFKVTSHELQEKAARDFVKKMMGRIVFLYFLQKKGWMGCKTKWAHGNENFMHDLFLKANKDSAFYMNFLQPLFFDTLNAKRESIDEDCTINKIPLGKVPFLNGGLFEREEGHPDNLTLDWEIFNQFFEVLNNYNFTIIEDDPDFKEVAVDPEMLGHIFENLLEDNKDKGAFYTPKEIVQYMCQESLIEYLHTKLSTNIKSDDLKEAICDLVTKQQFVKLNDLNQNADKYVLQALRDVKVCDPAIGSGAFPMGILQEIFRMVELLEDNDVFHTIWEMDKWDAARVKEDIIQNSIYGVDIEKGAVDIARLRFWLSIIIDEEEPKPLPNLDYKIVVGNSLLNKFEDHVIDIEWGFKEGTQTTSETHKYVKKRKILLQQISEKQKAYFDAESSLRNALSQEIKDLKIDILVNQLEMKVANEGRTEEPKQHNFPKKSNFTKAQSRYFQTLEWQDAIKKLKGIRSTEKPFHHFDWKLDFPEILNPDVCTKEIGFDIVIENPPYKMIQPHNTPKEVISNIKEKYPIVRFKVDLFHLFFKLSFEISSPHASIVVIAPSSLLNNVYVDDLRKWISKNSSITSLAISRNQMFENADVHTAVYHFKKPYFNKNIIRISTDFEKIISSGYPVFNNLNQSELTKFLSTWNLLLDEKTLSICNKIISTSTILSKVSKINRGLITGDKIKYFSEEKKNDKYLPILGGSDVIPFFAKNPSKYVLFERPKGAGGCWDKEVHTSKKIVIRQIGAEPTVGYDANGYAITGNIFSVIPFDKNITSPLLSILNSKLIKFFWVLMFTDFKETFPQVTIQSLSQIPISNAIFEGKWQKLLNNCLSQIKTSDENNDQQPLDLIVCKMYNIAFHEAQIVIQDLWLSEEEYNNLKLEEMV